MAMKPERLNQLMEILERRELYSQTADKLFHARITKEEAQELEQHVNSLFETHQKSIDDMESFKSQAMAELASVNSSFINPVEAGKKIAELRASIDYADAKIIEAKQFLENGLMRSYNDPVMRVRSINGLAQASQVMAEKIKDMEEARLTLAFWLNHSGHSADRSLEKVTKELLPALMTVDEFLKYKPKGE